MTSGPRDRGPQLDAALGVALFASKVAVAIALVALAGFRQISDDDYARTVIAQSFAHAPKLDPSGTSWLPFPFWITGGAMMIFGRSLEVARAIAIVASGAATTAFFFALRRAGLGRPFALAAAVFAAFGAWNIWLGAATVPEGFAGALVASSCVAIAMGIEDDTTRVPAWASALLFAAALSRYETWAACAVFSAFALLRARRLRLPARAFVIAALPLAAPLLWMGWNAFAHGDALHFFARVSNYRRALGASAAPLHEQLATYPFAFARAFPEAAVALPTAVVAVWRVRRLVPPAVAALAILLFLVAGELGDGAPTHHPERALVPIAWIVVALAAFAVQSAWRDKTIDARIAFVSAGVAVLVLLTRVPSTTREYPGQGAADRSVQIARGRALAGENPPHVDVEPCAYEHFALIAAFGKPERVTTGPITVADPRESLRPTCPIVRARR